MSRSSTPIRSTAEAPDPALATSHHLRQDLLLFVFLYLKEDHEIDAPENYPAAPNPYTDRAEVLAVLGRFFDDPELRPFTVIRTS